MRAHRLQQLEHAGVVDAGPQASSRSSSECGSRRPTRRRRHRTRVVWSRPRSIPRLQATMSAPPPPEPRAATPAAPATPPAARNPPPREPAPGRHWRDETPRTGCDATPRPTAAPACRVRDRGPAFRTWTPTAATTETRRAGYPLLDDRRDQGFQHLAGAAQAQVRQPAVRGGHGRMQRHEIAGVVGAPSMAGAMSTNSSAPLPHATQRAASRPARLIRAVTGPVGSKLVRQIVPSPGTRKHGSC